MATYSAIETGIAKALGLASAMALRLAIETEIAMALHSAIEKVLGLAPVKERGSETLRVCDSALEKETGLESGWESGWADVWARSWEASALSMGSDSASCLEHAWAIWTAHGLVICSATWKARG